MTLYLSAMLPRISPRSSGRIGLERDSFQDVMIRERAVCDELESIRAYSFGGNGRIFGCLSGGQARDGMGESERPASDHNVGEEVPVTSDDDVLTSDLEMDMDSPSIQTGSD
jgi:hypothetical protein